MVKLVKCVYKVKNKFESYDSSSLIYPLIISLIYNLHKTTTAWQKNIEPKVTVDYVNDDIQSFRSNQSLSDNFRLILPVGDYILIGARNHVYNVSATDLLEKEQISWHPLRQFVETCEMKGKSKIECQNYIRVLLLQDDERIFICGTNAFKPMCRIYEFRDGEFILIEESSGVGICPNDPNYNSTSLIYDGALYSATAADFSGNNPLIYKKADRINLRTELYDFKYFNSPNFVGVLGHMDFVFFFFREIAVEYINCGKIVYSRIGRVCKKDIGGNQSKEQWTSFLKARLNCSISGEFPFYFNEIQSNSDVIHGVYGNSPISLIYAIFTTPPNSIPGSAVCAFSLTDIMNVFEGSFKEQETSNSNWLPVHYSKVPNPRPGRCTNDSRTLPDATLNFIKTHPLVDEAVPAFFGVPVIHLVETVVGSYPVITEKIQIFESDVPIVNLKIIYPKKSYPKLIIVSTNEIRSLLLHRCHTNNIHGCSTCIALQDPYCAWNKRTHKCQSVNKIVNWKHSRNDWIQNISSGFSFLCPEVFEGYCFGKRCHKGEYDAGPCVDAEYEFLNQIPISHPTHDLEQNIYLTPHPHISKPVVDLVLNKNGTSKGVLTPTLDVTRRKLYV